MPVRGEDEGSGAPGAGRIASLDGIRGVAILLVLVFHGMIPGLRHAWIGVDLFFVLSGFLITRLLLAEHRRTGRISFLEFYKRRALRLAPALLLMCALFLAFALVFLPLAWNRLRETAEAALYVSNWSQALELRVAKYVGHTWSLGIEEQFYLLWPALLLGLMAIFRSRARLFIAVSGLAVASALWRAALWIDGASPERLYNGFDTRADTIFVGCALAFIAPAVARWWPLGVAGLIGALAVARWNAGFMFLGGYTLLAVAAALVIAGALDRSSLLGRVLSVRPLTAIGRISYGLYLFHYPVYAAIVDHVSWNPWYLNTIGLPLAVVLAILSWRFVEQPCLALRHVPMGRATTVALALLGPVSVVLGTAYLAIAVALF